MVSQCMYTRLVVQCTVIQTNKNWMLEKGVFSMIWASLEVDVTNLHLHRPPQSVYLDSVVLPLPAGRHRTSDNGHSE